jgi:hypothetical protein
LRGSESHTYAIGKLFLVLLFFFFALQVSAIEIIPRVANRKGVADPLDMVIFEGDEYTLPGWDMLSPHKDRLWTLKQYKKYITGSHFCEVVVLQ